MSTVDAMAGAEEGIDSAAPPWLFFTNRGCSPLSPERFLRPAEGFFLGERGGECLHGIRRLVGDVHPDPTWLRHL